MSPRLARPADAGLLRDLLRASQSADAPSRLTTDLATPIAEGRVWLLEAEGVPVAVLIVAAGATGIQMEALAVAAVQRRRGLGRALLAHAETEAQRRGQRRLWVHLSETEADCAAFLRSNGFVETQRAEQGGRLRIFLAKDLPAPPRPRPQRPHDRPKPPIWLQLVRSTIGPDRKPPSRRLIVLNGAGGAVMLGVAGLMAHGAVTNTLTARNWIRAEARVVAVLGEHFHKGVRWHRLRLEATTVDGRRIEGVTVRDHPVTRRLERPDPRTRVGDTLTVVSDPANPHRMATLDSLDSRTSAFIAIFFATFGAFGVALAFAMARARRLLTRPNAP